MIRTAWLIVESQAAGADTLAAVLQPDLLTRLEAIATILIAIVLVVALVLLLSALRQARRLGETMDRVVTGLEGQTGPVLERARSIAENVDYIATVARSDAQRLHDSVARLNERLRDASERMEERVRDFTALVEVLQAEAEDLALDTAAAVRGVRAGTQRLAGPERKLPVPPPEGGLPAGGREESQEEG